MILQTGLIMGKLESKFILELYTDEYIQSTKIDEQKISIEDATQINPVFLIKYIDAFLLKNNIKISYLVLSEKLPSKYITMYKVEKNEQ